MKRSNLSLQTMALAVAGVVVIIAVLSFILALLPIRYTPPVVAAFMLLAFLLGGLGYARFQNWSIQRTSERNWREARRQLGLEDPDDEPPVRYRR